MLKKKKRFIFSSIQILSAMSEGRTGLRARMSGNGLRMFFCLAIAIGLVIGSTSVQAQTCSNIQLTSQAEIDNLSNTCSTLTGSLKIYGSGSDDIVDLTPLRNLDITSVINLEVDNNSFLETLDGLEGLKRMNSWLGFYNNSALKNLEGLSGLESNQGAIISIAYNDSLESLQGLRRISNAESIYIENNSKLTNLDGLQGLETLLEVLVEGNDMLLSLKGLEGLRDVREDVEVYSNPALTSFCSLYPLLTEGTQLGGLYIFGNAADPTEAEIVAGGACVPDPTDYISQLLDSGIINDGQLSALLTKLNKCNSNALTNQANAFVNARIMTQVEADILVAATTASCL